MIVQYATKKRVVLNTKNSKWRGKERIYDLLVVTKMLVHQNAVDFQTFNIIDQNIIPFSPYSLLLLSGIFH